MWKSQRDRKGQEAVVLQRIQNPTRRYVSFTRRRNGLLKKAYELSLLCDAEVALILFSETGKLYQFANQEMRATLWRYESVSRGGASWASTSDSSALPKSETVEYFEVEREMLGKKKILVEKMQRNLAGEDLEQLSFEELKDLEQKLDRGLKRIRKHKMRILREEVKSLQGTVGFTLNEKRLLRSKLKEGSPLINGEENQPISEPLSPPNVSLQLGYAHGMVNELQYSMPLLQAKRHVSM